MSAHLRSWAVLPLMTLLAGPALAAVRTQVVEYQDGDVVLKSYVAYDDAVEGDRPGVLVFPEWWGLNEYAKSRARQLAEMGYVALAADMYGQGEVTVDAGRAKELSMSAQGQVMRRRATLALEALRAQQRVDKTRIAAIGYCYGGAVALNLAYSGADLDGVVAFHSSLPTPGEGDTIKARILAAHGTDDPLVPKEAVDAFFAAMRHAKADWTFIGYGNAVHSFTNPAAGNAGIAGVAYNAKADRRSWEHMKTFFGELFGLTDVSIKLDMDAKVAPIRVVTEPSQ